MSSSSLSSMLPGAPWLLAHRSMLPVDQPCKVSLYGNDYVMWRDRNENITALPNVCPHLGAMLSEGWCEARPNGDSDVVCPFHALPFDSEGRTVLPGTDRKTLPQLEPLELIVQGDFVWSYGPYEPTKPIPPILDEIASRYRFVGATADTSVATDLLTMLLNMHDYNHQNGTHRDLFKIESVEFQKFVDEGHYSEAFFRAPTVSATLGEKLRHPEMMMLPKVIEAHLENFFPSLVILHSESALGMIAQCHLFVPEADNRTRTYVLMFAEPRNALSSLMMGQLLKVAQTVVEQDTDILTKLYPDTPQNIRLNNEVGLNWVRQNFEHWPQVPATNLSR